jgi:hypothetical protein
MGYLSPHAPINRHRQPLPRMLSSPSRFWYLHPFNLTETGRAPRIISRANMNTSITSLTRAGSPCRSSGLNMNLRSLRQRESGHKVEDSHEIVLYRISIEANVAYPPEGRVPDMAIAFYNGFEIKGIEINTPPSGTLPLTEYRTGVPTTA